MYFDVFFLDYINDYYNYIYYDYVIISVIMPGTH